MLSLSETKMYIDAAETSISISIYYVHKCTIIYAIEMSHEQDN